jgi:signal transduction histidine kinase
VVVIRLRRIAELTSRLRVLPEQALPTAPELLGEVQAQARSTLEAMRRVLRFLREHSARAIPAAEQRRERRMLPAPTPSGVGLTVAFGLTEALFAARLPAQATQGAQHVQAALVLPHDAAGLLLVGAQLLALGWWRSAPLSALIASTAALCGSELHVSSNLIVDVSWALLVYVAAARSSVFASATAVGTSCAAVWSSFEVSAAIRPHFAVTMGGVWACYAAAGCLWALGALHRRANTRAREVCDQRAELDAQACLAAERARLARELHDVLAHHVSAIAVQAGAARVAAHRPDVLAEALHHLDRSGKAIFAGLADLLHLHPCSGTAGTGRLDAEAIYALAEPLRAAGLPLTVEVTECQAAPDEGGEVEAFARRILIEALTNVLRHAGPSPTQVTVEERPHELTITVADTGPVPGHCSAGTGSGNGVRGMRERAELLGGHLDAGRHPDGGWTVRARLPSPT